MPKVEVMLLERLRGEPLAISDVLSRIQSNGALPAQLLWLRLPPVCGSLDVLDTVALSQLRVLDCTR